MLDRDRILSRVADLDGYLGELQSIMPADFQEFSRVERKRACERLLQISIECVIFLRNRLGDFSAFRVAIVAVVRTP